MFQIKAICLINNNKIKEANLIKFHSLMLDLKILDLVNRESKIKMVKFILMMLIKFLLGLGRNFLF